MSYSPWDLYVFRSTSRMIDARELIEGIASDAASSRTADALVRAGELESALADASSPETKTAMALTDALAAALLGVAVLDTARVVAMARSMADAGEVRAVPPEGFSYYALHPGDVARRASERPLDGVRRAAVIGLRSIGTTMSAVVCAALRARGGSADRRTVRPQGEPYARVTRLSPHDARWVRRHVALGSRFIVTDEGPGLSGSSLLSVVDALAQAGVARDRVVLLCTRSPDPRTLRAPDAVRRWGALEVAATTWAPRTPRGYALLDAGGWRARFLAPDARWPGCWAWLERAKALSADGATLLKFEGLGRHGAEAFARACLVAQAGFGPAARAVGDGLVAYAVVPGRAHAGRLDGEVLDRLADYCAWRASAMPSRPADPRCLADMVRTNAAVALGVDLAVTPDLARPVVADGHMMPHEWLAAGDRLLKTDAASHGDDHLFPGPTDAAWDLAGAIVEWRMPRDAIRRFLDRYARRSGDRPDGRLPAWLLAYALHRLAWAEMAAATVGDGRERDRLQREADRRRRWLRSAASLGLLGKTALAFAPAA